MGRLIFRGLASYIPESDPAALQSNRSPIWSRVGTILGSAAEHEDPSIQRDIVATVRTERDILARQLDVIDRAIKDVEGQIDSPPILENRTAHRPPKFGSVRSTPRSIA